MGKQPIKKGGGIHKKGILAWKESHGMGIDKSKEDKVYEPEELTTSSANKAQSWIRLTGAFEEVTKLPGIPECTVIKVRGHSNTGKTTLLNEALVAAQKKGLIPVIFDTENNFSFQYAKTMGFEAEPIYGKVKKEVLNPETGEIEEKIVTDIIDWDGNFLYYNNRILADQYGKMDYSQGKETKEKRSQAVLEDIAYCMNELLDAQERGEINQGFLFCWDSVGSISGFRAYSSGKMANNMWDAGSLSVAFSNIINNRIPGSRKIASKYNNTFIYVNKVWMDNSTNPVGPPTMKDKGGNALGYACRLEILMGGTLSSAVKRLKATSKGANFYYGTQTKIKIEKNHLDAPHNVTYEGGIVATDGGFIEVDKVEEYKKEHVSDILKKLAEQKPEETFSESDVTFSEEDVNIVDE